MLLGYWAIGLLYLFDVLLLEVLLAVVLLLPQVEQLLLLLLLKLRQLALALLVQLDQLLLEEGQAMLLARGQTPGRQER